MHATEMVSALQNGRTHSAASATPGVAVEDDDDVWRVTGQRIVSNLILEVAQLMKKLVLGT